MMKFARLENVESARSAEFGKTVHFSVDVRWFTRFYNDGFRTASICALHVLGSSDRRHVFLERRFTPARSP